MKLKVFAVASVAALALLAVASSASATTLEIKGVRQTGSVAIKASLKAGTSSLWTDTFGIFLNTNTASTIEMKTESPFTGTTVGGPITSLSWSNSTEGNPTVDAPGTFSIAWIEKTTHGTFRSTGMNITMPSTVGVLTCTTSSTDLGTLTGVASGTATLDVNAVISCPLIGTVRWLATYSITSPEGLGVTS